MSSFPVLLSLIVGFAVLRLLLLVIFVMRMVLRPLVAAVAAVAAAAAVAGAATLATLLIIPVMADPARLPLRLQAPAKGAEDVLAPWTEAEVAALLEVMAAGTGKKSMHLFKSRNDRSGVSNLLLKSFF